MKLAAVSAIVFGLVGGSLVSPAGAGAAPAHAGCRAIKVPLASPFGTPRSCSGVRPGATVQVDGGLCTQNFVFAGSDDRTYAGTAGHCLFATSNLEAPPNKEKRWAAGTGPVALDGGGVRVGRFVYAVWSDDRDFALFQLDKGVRWSASMCHFGGPTRMYTDHSTDPTVVRHYGNGIAIGNVVPARTGVAEDTRGTGFVYAITASAPGDSGSGVMTADGGALGVLVGIDVIGETVISRLDWHTARAEKVLDIKLKLHTAKLR